jgi:hypothetical protein
MLPKVVTKSLSIALAGYFANSTMGGGDCEVTLYGADVLGKPG